MNFDMFTETPVPIIQDTQNIPVVVRNDAAGYDDEEGYYRVQIGEMIGHYKVVANYCLLKKNRS